MECVETQHSTQSNLRAQMNQHSTMVIVGSPREEEKGSLGAALPSTAQAHRPAPARDSPPLLLLGSFLRRRRAPAVSSPPRLLPSGIRRGRGSQHRRCRPGCLVERRLLPSGSGESRGWAGSGGRGCRAGVAPPPCLPVQVPLLSLTPLLRWRWCSGGAAACQPLPSRFDGSNLHASSLIWIGRMDTLLC